MDKKFLTIVFVFSFLLTIFLVKADLQITSKPSSLTVFQGGSVSNYFNIKNTGNLTNVTFEALNLPNGVNISFSPSFLTLNASETKKITFNITADSNADLGSETITINSSSTNNSISFDLTLNVRENYCTDGYAGSKLRLEVNNPDNGDDFYAGKNISVEVNVENKDNDAIDFVIEAQLYDITTGEEIESDETSDTLDEDDDQDYTLDIEIPSDIDSNDNYVVNVKVYEDDNEEGQCKEDSIDVDIKKKSYDLDIEKITLSNSPSCGGSLDLNVKVTNTGSKDQDDVIITIENSLLNLSSEKTKDIDSDDTVTFSFSEFLPIVAPGKYTIRVEASSDHASDSGEIEINLQNNCRTQVSDVSFVVLQQNPAIANQNLIFKTTLTNIGTSTTTYNINLDNYQSWATLTSVSPPSLTLNAGQSGDVLITLSLNPSASGTNTARVSITFNNQVKTQDVSVSLQSKESGYESLSSKIKSNAWLFIINIVLILVIICLIILIATKPKRVKEVPKEARLKRRK